MNITTLNMTTLDGGVVIKKGESGGGATINNQDKVVDITENGTTEVVADGGFTGLGKVTINTEVSGGGESDSQPNGAYRKLKFIDGYVGLRNLSEEELIALYIILDAQRKGSTYTGFVCTSYAGSGAFQENYRSNGYQCKVNASMAYAILYIYIRTGDYDPNESDELNEGLSFMWEEKDFEFRGMSVSIIDYAKIIFEEMFDKTLTDEEVYESLMIEDVDKAYYEERKTKKPN